MFIKTGAGSVFKFLMVKTNLYLSPIFCLIIKYKSKKISREKINIFCQWYLQPLKKLTITV